MHMGQTDSKLFLRKIIFSLILVPNLLWGRECSTLNYVTAKNSPFQKIPVYSQGYSGLCYAFAASQLLDYHYIKNGAPSVQTHPIWLGINYAATLNKSELGSGSIFLLLNQSHELKNCSPETIQKALTQYAKAAKLKDTEDLVGFLDDYFKNYSQLDSGMEKSMRVFEGLRKTATETKKEFFTAECLQSGGFASLAPFLEMANELSSTSFLKALLFGRCEKENKKLTVPELNHLQANTDEEAQDHLDRNLKNGPVGLGYCSAIHENPNLRYLKRNSNPSYNPSTCKPHAVVVTGRKVIDGQCHYLIRNSWGDIYREGDQKFTFLCKDRSSGEYFENCTIKTHPNSKYSVEGIWMKADSVVQNTITTTAITNQPRPQTGISIESRSLTQPETITKPVSSGIVIESR